MPKIRRIEGKRLMYTHWEVGVENAHHGPKWTSRFVPDIPAWLYYIVFI